MGTTTIPPLKPGADENVQGFYEAYVSAFGDYDKAGDMEDAAYYGGLIDAYYNVLVTLGAIDPEPTPLTGYPEGSLEAQIQALIEGDTA